jgi:hypothetical protein
MGPADDYPLQDHVGKRVAFQEGDDHVDCWHLEVGLKTGKVLKVGLTLAQKAALMGPESPIPPELLEDDSDEPRVWIKVDPCKLFPHGCEAAVEKACLVILD